MMLAATHFDNLLVFLFFGIAILFQLLSAAVAKKRKQQRDDPRRRSTSQTSRPLTTEVDESDEDRVRKFLEALGQPTTSKPPPPAAPRTDIPPRRVAPVSPPPEMAPNLNPTWRTIKRVLQPEGKAPPQPVHTKLAAPRARVIEPKVAEVPAFEVETKAQAGAQPIAQSRDLVTMLRSTSGLRDAIILREIFGPPRSMQPLDLLGSG